MLSYHEFEQPIKAVMDVTSLGVFIATVAQWLPGIAALFTVIWGALRIYDAFLDIQMKRQKLKTANAYLGTMKEKKKPDES